VARLAGTGELVGALPSPARIIEVGMAFWPAKVLLSAIELELFTELGANSMTGLELQGAASWKWPTPACTVSTEFLSVME
jgi:hypothetical protein